jgi:hypothetical protein
LICFQIPYYYLDVEDVFDDDENGDGDDVVATYISIQIYL